MSELKGEIVLGMSGGVDSSAAAYLLSQDGYEVIGVSLDLVPDCVDSKAVDCADAAGVCDLLGIRHLIVDGRELFKTKVIESFVSAYRAAITPNPCIFCNPLVKFALLKETADKLGADSIATGHYAQIRQMPGGRFCLQRLRDCPKDQSYALYRLDQEILSRTRFPLAGLRKEEIRQIAARAGISVAAKTDSQDICFIPDGDYARFIREYDSIPDLPGDFVSPEGEVLGRHKGIIHYTVGQRKGLGLALPRPGYVREIRPDSNEVVVGDDVKTKVVGARELAFSGLKEIAGEIRVLAKIRYNHLAAPATARQLSDDEIVCVFDDEQRAVTPGQSLVLYDEAGNLLAGGFIQRNQP